MLEMTGMKHVKYMNPVKFNDTIHLEVEVLEKIDDAEDTGTIVLGFNGEMCIRDSYYPVGRTCIDQQMV